MNDILSLDTIEDITEKIGILPFFKNNIQSFSIEEHTPEYLWFNDEIDGPWEWKGPIIRNFRCAYGKFFNKKAGYISIQMLPYLIKIRRNSFPQDMFTPLEKSIYELIVKNESVRSDVLKNELGLYKANSKKQKNPIDNLINIPVAKKNRKKEKTESFDTAITRLQMGTWIVCGDFEYSYTKEGKRYGWGKAVYVTPEAMYGSEIVDSCNNIAPPDALEDMCQKILRNINSVVDEPISKNELLNLIKVK